MCAIEARGDGEAAFAFWSQLVALVPGSPGVFVRRAFYRLTLDRCTGTFFVGFGAIFSHREVVVEDSVYIGPYAIVGSARLRRGCLIGSRAGIISGSALHALDANGQRAPTDRRRLRQVEIGEGAWIGEGALVLADVGRSATVAAGAVVSSPVVQGVVVAGNPSRFVRHLTPRPLDHEGAASAAM
jgi:acetyltransferase-like isoleucine patch superfamily enzyme